MAMGGPTPAPMKVDVETSGASPQTVLAARVFLIDNFESGSLKSPREWWTFDIQKAAIAPNKDLTEGEKVDVGNYSLGLAGPSKNWYAGGCGTYLAKPGMDLSKYNTLTVDIYGNGPGSGTLKIELYDDDNTNWQVEQDPAKNYMPIYDDKFTYSINVDWTGWRRIVIPLMDFVDENPGVGDDIWNPAQDQLSGGLLQMQLICLGNSDKGKINFNLDNMALTVAQ